MIIVYILHFEAYIMEVIKVEPADHEWTDL